MSTNGNSDPWLVVTDADGNMLAEETVLLPDSGHKQYTSLDVISEGAHLLIAGHDYNDQKTEAIGTWMRLLGPAGQTLWYQTYDTGNVAIRGHLRLAGGDIVLAGFHTDGAGFWLGRTDAWGHATCVEAGECADLGADQCSDDDACTLDSCQPAEPSLCWSEEGVCEVE